MSAPGSFLISDVGNEMASSIQSDNSFFDEWKTARDVLDKTDDNLHDLRKYGFTFVTALLTAQSILIPASSSSTSNAVVAQPVVKLAVFGVTLVLIIALQVIDRNYLVLQQAAATRALVLERTLNLELTEVISLRYSLGHVRRNVGVIYGLFVVGVAILGSVALSSDSRLIAVLLLFAVVAGFFIYKAEQLSYPYGIGDWSVNRLECSPGDEVEITLTNICQAEDNLRMYGMDLPRETQITFEKNQVLWALVKEEYGVYMPNEEAAKACISKEAMEALVDDKTRCIASKEVGPDIFVLHVRDSYVWPCKIPEETSEGVYELYRAIPIWRHSVTGLIYTKLVRLFQRHLSSRRKVEEYRKPEGSVIDLIKWKLNGTYSRDYVPGKYQFCPLPRKLRINKKQPSTDYAC